MSFLFYDMSRGEERHGLLTKLATTVITFGTSSYLTLILIRKLHWQPHFYSRPAAGELQTSLKYQQEGRRQNKHGSWFGLLWPDFTADFSTKLWWMICIRVILCLHIITLAHALHPSETFYSLTQYLFVTRFDYFSTCNKSATSFVVVFCLSSVCFSSSPRCVLKLLKRLLPVSASAVILVGKCEMFMWW